MISRSRVNISTPVSLLTKESVKNLNEIIVDISSGNKVLIKQGKDKITSKIYRGEVIDANGEIVQDVVESLKKLYEFKCAFCESKKFTPDVEHFRPKKRVTSVKGHQGYYWLAYEWTNLIPCCSDCNKIKLNSFPINNETNRVFGPTFYLNKLLALSDHDFNSIALSNEEPLIFHPEYDLNIEQSFIFNGLAEIKGIDKVGKGEITRIKCGLNRDDLLFFRQQIIDDYIDYFEMSLSINSNENFINVLQKLRKRAISTEKEYTLMCRYIYKNFVDIMVPLLAFPIQHKAEELFFANYNPI